MIFWTSFRGQGSRQARQLSGSGFYHIVVRGINHQHIFEDESDYLFFLEVLRKLKWELAFEMHAYCLLSNHIHLLLREKRLGDISVIMKRLLTKYVMWFNQKYQRSGVLIASRYKSIAVEVDEYFIPLQRYIHQNPMRGGLVRKMEDYSYSSYKEGQVKYFNEIMSHNSFLEELWLINVLVIYRTSKLSGQDIKN